MLLGQVLQAENMSTACSETRRYGQDDGELHQVGFRKSTRASVPNADASK